MVTYREAERLLGIKAGQRQNLIKAGKLEVVSTGHQRRVTLGSVVRCRGWVSQREAHGWGETEKAPHGVRILPGKLHRERVLTPDEEARYFKAAGEWNQGPILLPDVAAILLDCGLRPEECFRLRRENVRDGGIVIHHGKTERARRHIPVS